MSIDIGRPARDETNDYYHQYIDLVPDGDIRQILVDQRDEVLDFHESIPSKLAGHRYAEGKWSIAELLGHINDAERLYTMRAFWFARGMTTAMPSYEGDEAMIASRAGERHLDTHIHEFGSIRAATIDLFRFLPDDAWMRTGVASGLPFTVRAFAYIAAGHVLHHVGILKARYLV